MPGCRRKTMSKQSNTQRRGGRDARRNQQTNPNEILRKVNAERQLFRYLVTLAVAGAPKECFFNAAKAAKGMVRESILEKLIGFLNELDTCLYEAVYAKHPVKPGSGTILLKKRLDMLKDIESQFAVSVEERLGDLVHIMQVAP